MVDPRNYVKTTLMNPGRPTSSERYKPKPVDIGLPGQWFDLGPVADTDRSLPITFPFTGGRSGETFYS
jgi:hypothetical protein